MIVVFAAAIIAGAIGWGALMLARSVDALRDEQRRGRVLAILAAFAPGVGAAQTDPRALLVWQPLARTARAMYPEEFAALDRAAGSPFPFSPDRLQAAHAEWTADWLAWERSHDAEYKRKAADVEHDRARLDSVEREKLDSYQRRYEQYIRVAKALHALSQP